MIEIATSLKTVVGLVSEELISIPGLRIAARMHGSQDDPIVLALHGWLDNAASFDPLAQHLRGVRLVAIDLPGHGASSHHGPGHLYSFIDMVAAVHWITEAFGWSQYAILGHSLGGAIGSILAGTFPQRVTRMALLDVLGPATEEPDLAPIRFARALTEEARRSQAGPRSGYDDRSKLVSVIQAARGLRAEATDVLTARSLHKVHDQWTWRSDRRLRLPSRLRLSEAHVLEFLRRIECPTLLLRANQGIPFDPEIAQTRMKAVRNLRIQQVEGRHHVHLEYPERVAPMISDFFSPL